MGGSRLDPEKFGIGGSGTLRKFGYNLGKAMADQLADEIIGRVPFRWI